MKTFQNTQGWERRHRQVRGRAGKLGTQLKSGFVAGANPGAQCVTCTPGGERGNSGSSPRPCRNEQSSGKIPPRSTNSYGAKGNQAAPLPSCQELPYTEGLTARLHVRPVIIVVPPATTVINTTLEGKQSEGLTFLIKQSLSTQNPRGTPAAPTWCVSCLPCDLSYCGAVTV